MIRIHVIYIFLTKHTEPMCPERFHPSLADPTCNLHARAAPNMPIN